MTTQPTTFARGRAARLARLTALVIAVVPACTSDDDDDFVGEGKAALAGSWTAQFPVEFPFGMAYLTETISVTNDIESIETRGFLDEARTMPVLTYRSGGPYTIVGRSQVVEGAFELELINDTNTIEAHAQLDEIFQAIGLDDCDLKVDEQVDISGGCGGQLFPVANCVDHDIFFTDGAILRVGDREVDRCQDFPRALGPATYLKVE